MKKLKAIFDNELDTLQTEIKEVPERLEIKKKEAELEKLFIENKALKHRRYIVSHKISKDSECLSFNTLDAAKLAAKVFEAKSITENLL